MYDFKQSEKGMKLFMKEEIKQILNKYSQEHLLNYLQYMTKEEQEVLEEQIKDIDFEQLQRLYKITKQEPEIEEKVIEKIPYTDKEKLTNDRKEELEKIGKKVITSNEYAVITMAGGQGTRLGHPGPKGTYCLETVNGKKYLFEILVDTLKNAQKEYGVAIPWYIMTSKENNEQTISFLEEHNYFGYDKTKVKFFMQGELPLLTTNGKLILDKDKKVKQAANGNGGIYKAIEKNGILEDLKCYGVKWIFINSIDNVLCNFIDPLLIGLTVEQNNKIASKTVTKINPHERAGAFCKMNGRPKVIEYTELPEKMAEQVDENGELLYGELHIMLNLFSIEALEYFANINLPYHIAFKKSGYLNKDGEYIEPNEANVYKFEAFIFDAFEYYNDITILRVKRQDEFAPIKNKEGADSPATATALYNAKYSK